MKPVTLGPTLTQQVTERLRQIDQGFFSTVYIGGSAEKRGFRR